ncbi:MAG: sensor histidine kinase [Chloroflexi bacterium]|nr:sensor histidine kinase [Chloroflexota bacterium]
MNAISRPRPATIRARVHESAVSRVTRAYAATLPEIFAELLQNARRADATKVHVLVRTLPDEPDSEPRFSVTIHDDGEGIADPAVLLSFGENGWPDELVRKEDAAGFGFASLARRGCTVSTSLRSPGSGSLPAWRVDLAPEHFLGEAEAVVMHDESAPVPYGTAVSFPADESMGTIRVAAAKAARHFPLPVRIHVENAGAKRTPGEPLPSSDFLAGAVHAETWRGLAFGVFQDRRPGYTDPDLNFFGLTLPVRFPTVEAVNGTTWTVRTDVRDCPELELVLPARKEAVENAFLQEMREAARLAIYRAMAADPAPCPAFADHARAREAGIEIMPPPSMLRPWRPDIADADDWREPPKPAFAGPDAIIMGFDPEPPEAHALWRAAVRVGVDSRLFQADRRLAGYAWHDSLDRATSVAVKVADGAGGWTPVAELPAPEPTDRWRAPLPPRPAGIRIELAVRTASGKPDMIDLPADLAFAGEAWSHLDDARPLVTADSAIGPHDLAWFLAAAFFAADDDACADSHDTQRDRFNEEALHLATRLLVSDEDAAVRSIEDAVRRDLMWLCPSGREAVIRIRRPDVTVTLGDPAPDA